MEGGKSKMKGFDTFGDKPQRLALGNPSRKPEGLKKERWLVALSVNTEYTQDESRDKYRKQTPMLAIGVYECVDKDFKLQAVMMVTEGGHKASEVAGSLGIHPNQLYTRIPSIL